MEIKEYTTYHEAEILSLYASVGWTAYTASPEALRDGFANSLLVLCAYEGEELLGLIRVVGDGHTIVFVQDILVAPACQRQGVGSALLQAVLTQFSHVRQFVLVSDQTPQATAFYRAMGLRDLSSLGCLGWMRGE